MITLDVSELTEKRKQVYFLMCFVDDEIFSLFFSKKLFKTKKHKTEKKKKTKNACSVVHEKQDEGNFRVNVVVYWTANRSPEKFFQHK